MNPFTFHTNIEYEEHGEQWIGDCVFCEKHRKFYFNNNHLWDCKSCGRSGNLLTFLRDFYESLHTEEAGSNMVATWRDIPSGIARRLKPKFNQHNGSVLLPTFRNDKISNLYKAVESRGKVRILCTPETTHTLMNWDEHTEQIIWVCEGHFDRFAAEAITKDLPISATAAPGSSVWNKDWCELLSDKDVVFCYDSDNSGRVGFEKVIIKHISAFPQKPRSISYLNWNGVPDGYDLNDTWRDFGEQSYQYLEPLITPFKVPEGTVVIKATIETVEANMDIDTFPKFMEVVQKTYHVTQDMELCLLLVFTSIYSINIEGEQLWLRIIGPPGCGKTTIAKTMSASSQVVLRSTFTGLFSGWKDESDEDASLVPTIAGKSLMVKDADALLQQPNVDRIFSELRDFYDKDSSTQFKNRVQRDYRNIRSTMILFGTNALRRSDHTFLGERFLDFELRISPVDEDAISEKSMENALRLAASPGSLPPETEVQAAAKGLITHLMDRHLEATVTPELQMLIRRMSKLAAQMRTQVDRDGYGKGDITFTPRIEVPTRLIGQLTKLFLCGLTVSDDYALVSKLLAKVITDEIDPDSNRYRLCMDLMEGWYSRDALIETTGLTKSIVNVELDNLRALKMVDESTGPGSRPGRLRLIFTLAEPIKEALLELARI